jgi:hypothetical protein
MKKKMSKEQGCHERVRSLITGSRTTQVGRVVLAHPLDLLERCSCRLHLVLLRFLMPTQIVQAIEALPADVAPMLLRGGRAVSRLFA